MNSYVVELKIWQLKDIKILRDKYPQEFSHYLDNEIAAVIRQYSEMMHASGWEIGDHHPFMQWATQSPLDIECAKFNQLKYEIK